jgi:Fic family protein
MLPLASLDYRSIISLVGQANAALARYDGLLQGIVNPAVLLSPLTMQEAVLSSKIEGTQATVDEVFEHEAGQEYDEAKTQDIQEVVNYRAALMMATEQLSDRSITLGFIREMHAMLMNSVRGRDKSPGEFRVDQNWIGSYGCSIEMATFVPPSPLHLHDFLLNWESYLASNDFDPLVQTAIIHAQFELMHPFKDGNGRIGRLLIPLFLYSKKSLSRPMFYLSGYLEANRDEYYARLQAISKNGDWDGWIIYFLNAIIFQASDNAEKVRHVMHLYDMMKERIRELTHSQYSIQLLDAIFNKPIFQTTDFVTRSGIPKPTAMGLIQTLKQEGILITIREGSGRRAAILAFPELLNRAEGKKVI